MQRLARGILSSCIVAACFLVVAFGYVVWLYRVPPVILAENVGGAWRDIPAVFQRRDPACSIVDGLNAIRYEAFGRVAAARDEYERMRLLSVAGKFQQWRTSIGDFWITKENDLDLADMVAEGSRYSEVRTGEIVLDCGANVGVFTRRALAAGAKKVVAIEPMPANVECLRRSFADEIAQGRLVVSPTAVWDTAGGQMVMRLGNLSSTNSLVLNAGSDQIMVPVTTLDRLTAELELGRIDVIKMDIEGAEQRALKGATGILGRDRPRVYVAAYHLIDDALAIPQIIRATHADYRLKGASGCVNVHGRINPETLVFE